MEKDCAFECPISWKIITKLLRNAGGGLEVQRAPQQVRKEVKSPKTFGFFTSKAQINSLNLKKPSMLIYFECKFYDNILWNQTLGRLSLETQLENWVFCTIYWTSKLLG